MSSFLAGPRFCARLFWAGMFSPLTGRRIRKIRALGKTKLYDKPDELFQVAHSVCQIEHIHPRTNRSDVLIPFFYRFNSTQKFNEVRWDFLI
jgi:hypothetical protein